jgi:uncharacterized surface protein with fasciclin (FAS1) repeats
MTKTRKLMTGLLGLALVVPMTACNETLAVEMEERDIVQVAVDAGSFTTLVAAVQAAELVATLQGEGPFTVFAPSDAAFDALPAGTVESLLENPDALRAVLTYHVIPGRVMAADVINAGGAMPTTVNGQSLNVTVSGGVVRVNDATVVTADVMARNGVIHVIDRVLIAAM